MITVTKLGKHFGAKSLFSDVSLLLQAGARYGLVGANGSGKTTLLRILDGSDEPSDGSVSFVRGARVGVLRQDRFMNDDDSILNVAMEGDAEALEALVASERAYAQGDAEAALELNDALDRLQARTLKSRAGAILEGLGIKSPRHNDALRTLSGGYKLRVLLAQVLVARPDVLLLDEPTNHLDILSIRWLEKFLSDYKGCAVVISHDARFLQNTVSAILDVDYGTITLYPYGWTKFLADKAMQRTQKEAEIAGIEAEIERKRSFVERFGAKATKAAQAQSRVKQMDKLAEQLEDLPPSSRRAPRFRFEIARESGKEVLACDKITKSYGDKRVLHNVSLTVRQKERVAIIGENGAGKSTLLKIACDELGTDTGFAKWGHEVRPGYFAQDHKDLMDEDDTPYAFLSRASGDQGRAYIRGMLGRVLLTGDDAEKHCGALSGGEAARLVFARLLIQKPNVLVLDEPTNHLDLESIEALVDALKSYPGTLIFVSHDRSFVSALATRIFEVTTTGVRDFLGTYSEFLLECGDDHLDAGAVSLRERKAKGPSDNAASLSWEEQKKRKNQRALHSKRRDDVLKLLEAQEIQKRAIDVEWQAPGFFDTAPPKRQQELTEEHAAITQRIEVLVTEWEALELKLSELA